MSNYPSTVESERVEYKQDLYEWEGLFAFVGFLETSLVE